MSGPCEQGRHDELDKGDEKAWEDIFRDCNQDWERRVSYRCQALL